MNGRLHQIQNWSELAQRVNWSVAALATECNISVRTLERYFLKAMGRHPQAWLCEQRQQQAIVLLRNGCNVKKTATLLGYKHATHFSREFKKHWGHAPTKNGYDIANNVVFAGSGRKCRVLV